MSGNFIDKDTKVDEYLACSHSGIFKTALPEFKELRDFEWIGYPEMRADMVQAVLASHKHLHGLGLMYATFSWEFHYDHATDHRVLIF